MSITSTTFDAVKDQIQRGGRFVRFPTVVSLLVVSMTMKSGTYFIPPGKSSLRHGWPFLLATLLFGWWSTKGIIRTFQALGTFSGGGEDVSYEVMSAIDVGRSLDERPDRPRYV